MHEISKQVSSFDRASTKALVLCLHNQFGATETPSTRGDAERPRPDTLDVYMLENSDVSNSSSVCSDVDAEESCACGGAADPWSSPVVRRDDLVIVDEQALGTLCEDVQIASRRIAGVLDCEWFRNGSELTLVQTFASSEAAATQSKETWVGRGFTTRVARSCRVVRTAIYGCPSEDMIEVARKADILTRTQCGVGLEVHEPIGETLRRPHVGSSPYRMRYEFEAIGDLDAVTAFVLERQALARADADILNFDFFLAPGGKRVTLIACYADAAAHQRSLFRWMKAGALDHFFDVGALVVTAIHTYGHIALTGDKPPPGWTELMLVAHHQEPVGRCFRR